MAGRDFPFRLFDGSSLAFDHGSQAFELPKTYDCTNFYCAETWWTHARILVTLEEPEAKQHLESLVNWVLKTNTEHVPSQYQKDFLEHNAVNAAILEIWHNYKPN